MTVISQTASQTHYVTLRHVRALLRQPWWVAISLVQPVIYLLLFGALFERVAVIPGFEYDSYVTFLAPGIVIMSALFSGSFTGIGVIEDIDRGVLDRFLVTPVRRTPLLVGRLIQQSIVTAIQALILIVLALAKGAQFPGGIGGIAVLVICAVLVGSSFGSLSNALALWVRRGDTVIAAIQFVILPLSFLSAVFLQLSLAPGWIAAFARFNPANWAVVAGREAVSADADWSYVLSHVAYLLAFAVVTLWLSLSAFRSYRRSA